MKIAICKFAGMGNGGIEKYLQTLSIILKKNGYDVDFFYTNWAPIIGSSWTHPNNDKARIEYVKSQGINLIEISVEARNDLNQYEWVNTDFFNHFNEEDYEFIIFGGNGVPEFPYNKLDNIKIIHTVHGDNVFNKNNIHKSVLLSQWQANRWISKGGNPSKLEIIPSIVYTPETYTKTLRERYNIPSDAFVYGFHQRNDNSISSSVSLEAYSRIQDDNTYFAILGGADLHRDYVKYNNLKNVIFVDYTSNVNDIHDFLDGIDVYAHCRLDGEVCSASIIEAMYHKKPLISYPGLNMGHLEQLENCGKMTYSVDEYKIEMIKLRNKEYYDEISERVKNKYYTFYDYKIVEKKLLNLLK